MDSASDEEDFLSDSSESSSSESSESEDDSSENDEDEIASLEATKTEAGEAVLRIPRSFFTDEERKLLRSEGTRFREGDRQEKKKIVDELVASLRQKGNTKGQTTLKRKVLQYLTSNTRTLERLLPWKKPRMKTIVIHEHDDEIRRRVKEQHNLVPGDADFLGKHAKIVKAFMDELSTEKKEELLKKQLEWQGMGPPKSRRRKVAETSLDNLILRFSQKLYWETGARIVVLAGYRGVNSQMRYGAYDYNRLVGNGKTTFPEFFPGYKTSEMLQRFQDYLQDNLTDDEEEGSKTHSPSQTKSVRVKRTLPKLATNRWNEPLLPSDLSKMRDLDERRTVIRAWIAAFYNLAAGTSNTPVPWASIITDPGSYIDKGCWPENVTLREPSKLRVEEVRKLLEFWAEREKDEAVPAFQFHHTRGIGKQSDLLPAVDWRADQTLDSPKKRKAGVPGKGKTKSKSKSKSKGKNEPPAEKLAKSGTSSESTTNAQQALATLRSEEVHYPIVSDTVRHDREPELPVQRPMVAGPPRDISNEIPPVMVPPTNPFAPLAPSSWHTFQPETVTSAMRHSDESVFNRHNSADAPQVYPPSIASDLAAVPQTTTSIPHALPPTSGINPLFGMFGANDPAEQATLLNVLGTLTEMLKVARPVGHSRQAYGTQEPAIDPNLGGPSTEQAIIHQPFLTQGPNDATPQGYYAVPPQFVPRNRPMKREPDVEERLLSDEIRPDGGSLSSSGSSKHQSSKRKRSSTKKDERGKRRGGKDRLAPEEEGQRRPSSSKRQRLSLEQSNGTSSSARQLRESPQKKVFQEFEGHSELARLTETPRKEQQSMRRR